MNIQHKQQAERGEFVVLNEAQRKVAELSYYFVDEQTVNANHTFVDPSLRGQGLADKLYQAFAEFVQQRGLKVIAGCSYVARKRERESAVGKI